MIDINKIIEYYNDDKIFISEHANIRIIERNIKISDIAKAIKSGEIIEQYEEDEPFPACLILGFINNDPLHVAISDAGDYAKIITVYRPSKDLWIDNYRRRVSK